MNKFKPLKTPQEGGQNLAKTKETPQINPAAPQKDLRDAPPKSANPNKMNLAKQMQQNQNMQQNSGQNTNQGKQLSTKAMIENQRIRNQLIAAGVQALQQMGHRLAHKNNIMGNKAYSPIFKQILQNNRGKNNDGGKIDAVIDELISQCKW